MGFIDKLKNVFFEEIEEEEKEEDTYKLAKKVELPRRKVEVEPKVENPEKRKVDFSEKEYGRVSYNQDNERDNKEEIGKVPLMFEEEDFFGADNSFESSVSEEKYERREYPEQRVLYPEKRELSYMESVNKNTSYTTPYSNTAYSNSAYSNSSYSSSVNTNTSYSKSYEEKNPKAFRPSPIISPIYGILDKNYKKEEVVAKKEPRVVSSYSGKADLDSVRNKAFGNEKVLDDNNKKVDASKIKKEEKKFYDVNNSKPSVDRITIADADEYYNELGLAYNVDYDDTSRDIQSSNKSTKSNISVSSRSKRYQEVENMSDDDNLFDLIDSMYNKED